MKAFLLVILLGFCSLCGMAQQSDTTTVHGVDIPLCCGLDSPVYEYSGMAKWKHKILLVPQYPDKWENAIFAADSMDIAGAINKKPAAGVPYIRITINNLDSMRRRMKGTYQGFEGAVVIGNSIYFTLEFSEDTCYLLKGYINERKGKTNIDLVALHPVRKPAGAYANAGYESIGYLPGSRVLSIFFEQNHDLGKSFAVFTDTSFSERDVYQPFSNPMYFRLTDVAANGRHSFIGINHYYNDYNRKRKEYNYYIGDDNKAYARYQMGGADPATHHYTSIVEITQQLIRTDWKTKKFISFGDENWEGIIPFGKGFLMVVDEYPKDGTPRMRYFDW